MVIKNTSYLQEQSYNINTLHHQALFYLLQQIGRF